MTELSLSQTPSIPESPAVKTMGPFSERELRLERGAVRKLDCRILPVMTLFFLLSIMDRSNIGNARVAGLQHDLHLTDTQYQICISIILVPFILSELPSSLLLRKIGPRFLLPTIATIWGMVAALQGFATSYAGLVIVRLFLGLVEGPLIPAIILYLSGFYTRKELSLRIAIFFTAASLSGTFSSLLAAAIENMNGIGGLPGWAWIFIIEGLLSVVFGIVSFFLVPSTLRDCRFLTECEKELVMNRLERDRPSIALLDTFSFKQVIRSASSPHVIMVLIMKFLLGTILFGSTFFLPSIVNELGFSPNKTQLLSVGPYATGFFVTLIAAFFSDRYESRGITLALVIIPSIAGFSLFLSAENRSTTYGALYLMVPGLYGALPVLSAWLANNSEPHYRRATTIALSLIFFNSGFMLSAWSFPTKDGPKYRKTTIMNLIFSIFLAVGSLINMTYLSWRNKVKKRPGVRAKLLEKYAAVDKEGDDGALRAWIELGDGHPDFVYTL